MLGRVLVTAAACVLGGVVLALLIYSGAGVPRPGAGGSRITLDDPEGLPGLTNPEQAVDPRRLTSPGRVRRYYYSSRNKKNQLIQIAGLKIEPRPHGVSDVTRPMARIHLKDFERVIQIQADQGTLIAPDNEPRSGDLKGHVVITLFEAEPGQWADMSPDSPDVRLRVYLDEAKFDLELNLIDSDSPVHVTGRRLDFKGMGLNLTYNEKRKRLERLEVTRGQELRFTPQGPAPAAAGTANAPAAPLAEAVAPPADAVAPPVDSSSASSSSRPPAPKPPVTPQSVQFYRAVFDSDVRVRSKELNSESDALAVLFSLGGHSSKDEMFQKLGAAPPGLSSGTTAVTADVAAPETPDVAAPTAPDAAISAAPQEKSLAPRTADDVIVKWTGRLLVVPLESAPPELAGPDDVMLTLTGRPVRIVTTRKENVLAAEVQYVASSGLVRMTGTPVVPLVVDSPRTGELRGTQMVVNQSEARGWIEGAGSLRAYGEPGSPPGDQAAQLPPGLSAAWSQRLDFTFHMNEPTAGKPARRARSFGRIEALKTADFHGAVAVKHPQFDLAGDHLALALSDPNKRRQQLQDIGVDGHVHVQSHAAEAERQIDIQSDKLDVQMAADADGYAQPSRLHATGGVVARQPHRKLRAELLDVTLGQAEPQVPVKGAAAPAPGDVPAIAPKPNAPADAPKPGVVDKFVVTKMLAQTNVQVDLDDSGARVQADRLVADMKTDVIELFGTDEQPVLLLRPDSTIMGAHMILNQRTQTVDVLSGGKLTFVSQGQPKVVPAAGAPDSAGAAGGAGGAGKAAVAVAPAAQVQDGDAGKAPPQSSKDVLVTVRWARSMHFDNKQNHADFVGDVVSDALAGSDTSHLTAGDLYMKFVDAPPPVQTPADAAALLAPVSPLALASPIAPTAPGGGEASLLDQLPHGRKEISMAVARGDAKFVATTWQDKVGGLLATRFSLDGPQIVFDRLGANEGVRVVGEGSMLIEDYRPAEHHGRTAAANQVIQPNQANQAKQPAQPTPSDQPPAPGALAGVKFTGRGATLFKWQRQLTLDAQRNDVKMEEGVQMFHQSADTPTLGTVQLDCRWLLADFEETGGIGVWLSGRNPQPQFKSLDARGEGGAVRVIVRDGDKKTVRTATTDHLSYTAFDQTVVLEAPDGRLSEISVGGEPAGLTAQTFKWDLRRDRIEVIKLGAGRVPIKVK